MEPIQLSRLWSSGPGDGLNNGRSDLEPFVVVHMDRCVAPCSNLIDDCPLDVSRFSKKEGLDVTDI